MTVETPADAPVRLRFLRDARTPGQTTAYHQETGLGFVITRVESKGPRGGRVFEYEVEYGEAGGRVRLQYAVMQATAFNLCEKIVADRLSGADR
jgi:hypothetical protein